MKKNTRIAFVGTLFVSLIAIVFLTGASSRNDRWAISAVSGGNSGLYIMDQQTGDIFFLDDDPNISRSRAKIEKLGNISQAR